VNEGLPPHPPLPIRDRSSSSRPGGTGRHRRPVPSDLPPDAPALVVAAPGRDDEVPQDIARMLRVDNPQVDVRLVHLGDGIDGLAKELDEIAASRPQGAVSAVVAPLVTGPHPKVYRMVREAIAASGTQVMINPPLGPHPLIAEVMHIRLADAGLARADRVRLFNIASPVDGIIVLTAGGPEAVRAADTTAVLLAARLAIPVVAASVDDGPGPRDAAERLHKIGASRLAIAPCIIGPEADPAEVRAAAESIGAGCAQPIGAHTSLARLIIEAYGNTLYELE
jgi:sirohydrochlorin ferrochelatase